MYYKLRRPCKKCPFRTDCPEGWLGAARAQDIVTSITARDKTFACHETTYFDDDGEYLPMEAEQHCAGALIFAVKSDGHFNQLTRIAERLNQFDPEKLDLDAPVFASAVAMVTHHAGADYEEPECCSVCGPECEAPAGYMIGGEAVSNVVEEDSTSLCPNCYEPICEACTCWCRENEG